jgi:outer membrane protein assembly factor BamB
MPRRCAAVAGLLAVIALGCGHDESTVAPHLGATASADHAPVSGSWLTYHRSLARTGYDARAAAPRHVRNLWTASIDGDAYAQPLIARGKVIVATENDSVYALDARTGRTRWRAHLGTPVPQDDLPCGNIDPTGITGTPAIDAHERTVYAVTFERPAHHTLVALALTNGAVRWRRPIDPAGADPKVHQERAALSLSRGRVYVAYGGLYGDCGNYHGWVIAASASGPDGSLSTFRVPTHREGGIWAPPGAAIDRAGNLYVATGNGDSSSFDFGNAVIRLSPDLRRSDFFAPREAGSLNSSDTDLGSTGPLLLPDRRVFAIGKSGVGYLLSTERLGGIGGQLFSRTVCSAAFGASTYARGLIYVPCDDGLRVLRLRARSFEQAWRGPSFRAGPPIVAGRTAWDVDLDAGRLYAFDAHSGRVEFRAATGQVDHFASPAEAGGRVYVAAKRRLLAFGAR